MIARSSSAHISVWAIRTQSVSKVVGSPTVVRCFLPQNASGQKSPQRVEIPRRTPAGRNPPSAIPISTRWPWRSAAPSSPSSRALPGNRIGHPGSPSDRDGTSPERNLPMECHPPRPRAPHHDIFPAQTFLCLGKNITIWPSRSRYTARLVFVCVGRDVDVGW